MRPSVMKISIAQLSRTFGHKRRYYSLRGHLKALTLQKDNTFYFSNRLSFTKPLLLVVLRKPLTSQRFVSQATPMMETRIVKVPSKGTLGHFRPGDGLAKLDHWEVHCENNTALKALEHAAHELRTTDTPVAFPTETVYGLGADATRTPSVKGIYSAKGRPSDNPLISHVCDLEMLRQYIGHTDETQDPIPERYRALIERFWPGPLTILLPNPVPSKLAPEVTAGLKTFGVRMPSSTLALSLIKLAGVPLAAPSANASTKPSPTAAQHVKDDLDGRIELILDGGHCHVGVESTVVDGLCDPPVVLRPGGIGIDELRTCPGWENVTIAYKDKSEEGKAAPRAPGMKYKHYSPKATVVLYESSFKKGDDGIAQSDFEAANETANGNVTNGDRKRRRIGVIRTQRWKSGAGLRCANFHHLTDVKAADEQDDSPFQVYEGDLLDDKKQPIGTILDIDLGRGTEGIARGLFAALREFDRRGADTIFVDGIEDKSDIAAAVMNRLRKAASETRA